MSNTVDESRSEIRTREFLISDYADVAALWAQVEGVEIAEGDSREEIRGYLDRNPGLSRVAVEGEKIVGAALCGHDGRRGFIYHLAIAAGCRGRGLGKMLVKECNSGLRANGITRAIILVADDNPQGLAFWLNDGWETLSEAIPMAKDVG